MAGLLNWLTARIRIGAEANNLAVAVKILSREFDQLRSVWVGLPYENQVREVLVVLDFAHDLAAHVDKTLDGLRPYLKKANANEVKQAILVATQEMRQETEYVDQICLKWISIIVPGSDPAISQPLLGRGTSLQETVNHVAAANKQLHELLTRGTERLDAKHGQSLEQAMIAVLAGLRQALLVLKQRSEHLRHWFDDPKSLTTVN